MPQENKGREAYEIVLRRYSNPECPERVLASSFHRRVEGILLFAGDRYYANGGIEDFQGKYPSRESCLHFLRKFEVGCSGGWYQLVSSEDFTLLEAGDLKSTFLNKDSNLNLK
jgi:hypothetical protein